MLSMHWQPVCRLLKISKLDMEKEDADRIGVIVGSGVGGLMTMEEQVKRLTRQRTITSISTVYYR